MTKCEALLERGLCGAPAEYILDDLAYCKSHYNHLMNIRYPKLTDPRPFEER